MEPIPNVFNSILTQPAVPFVQFTEAETAAYNYICSINDWNGGVRTLYNTTNADLLINIRITLINLTPIDGPGFSVSDFAMVTNTLSGELAAASNVAAFFDNLQTIYNQCFSLGSMSTTQMINDCGLKDTPATPVTGLISNIVVGVATTLLSEIPVVGSIISGLVQTTVQAVKDGVVLTGPQPPDQFNVEVSKLFDMLATSFFQLSGNIADIHATITSDWGMLQATSTMMSNNGANSPLFWDDSMTLQVEKTAQKAYSIEALKLLLPIQYCVYKVAANGSNFEYISNESTLFQPANKLVPGEFTPALRLSTRALPSPWTWYYYLASRSDANATLDSQDIYNLINGNSDVFLGLSGWSFLNTSYDWTDSLTVRIINNSPATFSITCTWGNGKLMLGSVTNQLAPFSALDYMGSTTGLSVGNAIAHFQLWDDETPSHGLRLEAQLPPASVFSAGTTIITDLAATSNIYVVTDDVNGASNAHDLGGGALFVIDPNPNLPTENNSRVFKQLKDFQVEVS